MLLKLTLFVFSAIRNKCALLRHQNVSVSVEACAGRLTAGHVSAHTVSLRVSSQGQADLLKYAKNETVENLKQIHYAAVSCGLLESIQTPADHKPPLGYKITQRNQKPSPFPLPTSLDSSFLSIASVPELSFAGQGSFCNCLKSLWVRGRNSCCFAVRWFQSRWAVQARVLIFCLPKENHHLGMCLINQ